MLAMLAKCSTDRRGEGGVAQTEHGRCFAAAKKDCVRPDSHLAATPSSGCGSEHLGGCPWVFFVIKTRGQLDGQLISVTPTATEQKLRAKKKKRKKELSIDRFLDDFGDDE